MDAEEEQATLGLRKRPLGGNRGAFDDVAGRFQEMLRAWGNSRIREQRRAKTSGN